eukprot:5152372-Amphidinium_carterae.1
MEQLAQQLNVLQEELRQQHQRVQQGKTQAQAQSRDRLPSLVDVPHVFPSLDWIVGQGDTIL